MVQHLVLGFQFFINIHLKKYSWCLHLKINMIFGSKFQFHRGQINVAGFGIIKHPDLHIEYFHHIFQIVPAKSKSRSCPVHRLCGRFPLLRDSACGVELGLLLRKRPTRAMGGAVWTSQGCSGFADIRETPPTSRQGIQETCRDLKVSVWNVSLCHSCCRFRTIRITEVQSSFPLPRDTGSEALLPAAPPRDLPLPVLILSVVFLEVVSVVADTSSSTFTTSSSSSFPPTSSINLYRSSLLLLLKKL